MINAAEFKSFYDRELLPSLQNLEGDRKKLINGSYKYIAIGLIPFAISVVLAGGNVLDASWIALAVGIVLSAIVFFFLNYKKIGEIQSRFKSEVIAKMVKAIDPSLSYQANGKISDYDYHKSKLYLSQINKYKGDDLVTGTVGKTAIRFSELLTQMEKETTDSKGNKSKSVTTIFKGLFFVGDFNKKFIGETIVLPDTAENLFGSLGTMLQKWNVQRDQLVKMEDPEFEKAFAVYGTDQVEARYILSTSLMQRILQFKQKTRSNMSMSFIANEVFIGVPLRENLFEAPFFSSMVKYERIESFNKYLVLFIGIVEDLNLNTRIWTKE
ncbi:MAG TPA: DUF3137 domain-containing protein [Cyclobacteriaceae bacterium]|nr:DUF3137 domain-containing protein [Cyclobacteriaceae bacterium]